MKTNCLLLSSLMLYFLSAISAYCMKINSEETQFCVLDENDEKKESCLNIIFELKRPKEQMDKAIQSNIEASGLKTKLPNETVGSRIHRWTKNRKNTSKQKLAGSVYEIYTGAEKVSGYGVLLDELEDQVGKTIGIVTNSSFQNHALGNFFIEDVVDFLFDSLKTDALVNVIFYEGNQVEEDLALNLLDDKDLPSSESIFGLKNRKENKVAEPTNYFEWIKKNSRSGDITFFDVIEIPAKETGFKQLRKNFYFSAMRGWKSEFHKHLGNDFKQSVTTFILVCHRFNNGNKFKFPKNIKFMIISFAL